MVEIIAKTTSSFCGKCSKERLRVQQVGRVKALGEPAVDRRQELAGLGPFALPLPEPRQARSRAQLQGLGLLAAGDVQGPPQPSFRFCLRRYRPLQEQDAP